MVESKATELPFEELGIKSTHYVEPDLLLISKRIWQYDVENDMEKGSDEEVVETGFPMVSAGVRHFDNIGNINNGMRLLI